MEVLGGVNRKMRKKNGYLIKDLDSYFYPWFSDPV